MIDFHTHHPSQNSIINVSPTDFCPQPGMKYSMGIHPWDLPEYATNIEKLMGLAEHPAVVMIGETGIDRLRGGEILLQMQIFKDHIATSEHLHKPLIIHCVRAYQEILSAKRSLKPAMAWIIHGFRGNAAIAKALIANNINISLGERFNSDALHAIPLDHLLIETDDSSLPIADIYAKVAAELSIPMPQLIAQVDANAHRILNL